MNLGAEKATAARSLRAVADRYSIPEAVVVEEWRRLEGVLDDSRSAGSAELALNLWRSELEERLASRFAQSPLDDPTSAASLLAVERRGVLRSSSRRPAEQSPDRDSGGRAARPSTERNVR